ncbi:MAG: hypothetical protein COV08_03615 [Candidatus Vogelbacteria bacterium CG10_big_fil_rev_8_21_14_0_10_49_38]|uniref:Uncharacterized protein n=1 Tax=Candidatus Vogelbacteria bacterium CG10_big_fil_rev_8_21_14_0_10_49_38 TaxID=1975043 RepID=A0A2H0RGU3_9BACT|nr:MAG: hypothetical protein BK006_03605 [bacterium CG10_49_38]PIR45723.1 MAG: hypothetical protein COV08_03615 [Candidatus Vogelbacteria bacterium CG10_big_fil_rev_8_21_14_0_10_49_38]
MENLSSNALEAEIAALQQKIEEKKNLLEQENGIIEEVDEKKLLRDSVNEMFTPSRHTAALAPNVEQTSAVWTGEASYLDRLDGDSAARIKRLIDQLPQVGIAKTVVEAETDGPFVVDALHDLLVDRLYDELKSRGIIK